MGAGAQPTLRIPLLLLTAADLVLLAMRLRPWQGVMNLPGNGATGIDPGVTLLAYFGLVFWLSGKQGSLMVHAHSAVTRLGLLGGVLLAGRTWFGSRQASADLSEFGAIQISLMAAAALCWGLAGLRAAQEAKSVGGSLLAGAWAAMISSLMAVAALLGLFFVTGPPPETRDSYKQFQEIGIGDPGTVVLVHSLNATQAFLLIAPLAGSLVGLAFASIRLSRKAKPA
jgi:hypothetical protein